MGARILAGLALWIVLALVVSYAWHKFRRATCDDEEGPCGS